MGSGNPPCASPLGRSLRVNPRSFSSSSPLARARGRSLRVHPPSFCAPLPSPYANPRGEAFAYIRGRFSPPFFWRVGRGTRTTLAEAGWRRSRRPQPSKLKVCNQVDRLARGGAAGGGVFLLLHKSEPGGEAFK